VLKHITAGKRKLARCDSLSAAISRHVVGEPGMDLQKGLQAERKWRADRVSRE
jgi:hypothetical protein